MIGNLKSVTYIINKQTFLIIYKQNNIKIRSLKKSRNVKHDFIFCFSS